MNHGMPMSISTPDSNAQPSETTILLIKQMARMYRTIRQADGTLKPKDLN